MATDTREVLSLRNAWSSVSNRLATAIGAAVALGAVLADVPVRIASLRGAAALIGVRLVAHFGLKLALKQGAASPPKERQA